MDQASHISLPRVWCTFPENIAVLNEMVRIKEKIGEITSSVYLSNYRSHPQIGSVTSSVRSVSALSLANLSQKTRLEKYHLHVQGEVDSKEIARKEVNSELSLTTSGTNPNHEVSK